MLQEELVINFSKVDAGLHHNLQESAKAWLRANVYKTNQSGGVKRYFLSKQRKAVQYGAVLDLLLKNSGLEFTEAKRTLDQESAKLNWIEEDPQYLIGIDDRVCIIEDLTYPNLWKPYPYQPQKDLSVEQIEEDAKPFLDHLRMMATSDRDSVEEADAKVHWLIQLLARKHQMHEPHKKLHIVLYLYGGQGSGKTGFGRMLAGLFGEYAVQSTGELTDFASKSSIDLWVREWLHVDEVDVRAGSSAYNTIKTRTGNDTATADKKNKDFSDYRIPANLVMTSNHAPNFLEADDRRHLVINWDHNFESSEAKSAYMREYHDWMLSNEGMQSIVNYLHSLEITLTMADVPPVTWEKRKAIGLSVNADAALLEEVLNQNEGKHAWSFSSLCQRLPRIKPNQIKHLLSSCGWQHIGSKKITIEGGRSQLTIYLRDGWLLDRSKWGYFITDGNDKYELSYQVNIGETLNT
jgi:hypothetical protein